MGQFAEYCGKLAETDVRRAFDEATNRIVELQNKLAEKNVKSLLASLVEIELKAGTLSFKGAHIKERFKQYQDYPTMGNLYTSLGFYAELLQKEVNSLH